MPQIFLHDFLIQAILLATTAQAQNIGTITQDITTYAAFSQQKPCARTCFQTSGGMCNDDFLGAKIGCARTNLCESVGWQARNDCYCSAGLQIPAQEYLSGCISSRCAVADVSIDVSSAVSIYSRYCGEKSYVAGSPINIPATRTSSTSPPRTTSPGASAPTAGTSDGSSTGSSSNSPSSSKLSTGSIIGIVVGACAGLFFIAAAMWVFWKLFAPCFSRKASNQQQRPQVNDGPIFPPPPPNQQPWYSSPGPASDLGPSDSVSMVGGLGQPNPTLVSDNRYPGRWA
jgi:hypothetical protein